MNDPSCPGSKTDYVWTLTKCDVNGVAGRVIRPARRRALDRSARQTRSRFINRGVVPTCVRRNKKTIVHNIEDDVSMIFEMYNIVSNR